MDRRTLVLALVVSCARSEPMMATPEPPGVAPVPAIAVAPYPEPPQQKAAWTAPKSGLDAKVIAAVTRLFDQGVADPRGCAYREIEIEVTEGWDDAAKRVKTHGWVLPAQQFAVAWNGLVYRTQSIGAAASVSDDVRALLDAQRKARDAAKREDPDSDFFMFPVADEGYYVSYQMLAPGKAMMLLRLGDGAAAESVWKAAAGNQAPYAVLADDWLWAQFGRGVGAHRRGDVALAIESWRRLPALAVAARTDVSGDGIVAGDQGAQYLQDIAALFADEQRRAAHPTPPLDLAAVAKLPPAERIARLVAALDQVTANNMSGPDPITKALHAEGEAAVEALLGVYETDERRTRSRFVDFKHGDSGRYRHIIPVYEVAHSLISGIVDTSFFQPTATDRRGLAAELRAYWKTWRGVSRFERQYKMFADDKLDESQWLTAAVQITAATGGKLAGESLRTKASPSVTSLFERRLTSGYADLRQRAQVLQAFAAWDAQAAKPHLAKTVREGFAGWATAEHRGMDPYLGEALVGLTTARIAAGDTAALAEYADWLVTTVPEQAQFAALRWFAPMIARPDAPEMVRASKALFGTSAWVPLTSKRAGYYMLELLGSELVHVAAFRTHALAQLSNHARLGTMKMVRGGLDVRTEAFQQGEGVDANDPLLPKNGWTDTLRVADQYAASLVSGRTDAPKFRRYWPVAERDRAIAAIAAWLNKQ